MSSALLSNIARDALLTLTYRKSGETTTGIVGAIIVNPNKHTLESTWSAHMLLAKYFMPTALVAIIRVKL
jgi:hypothetical protein